MKTRRTVVITGAAGGIGALLVERFLANGDIVVATDTSESGLSALVSVHQGAALHVLDADIASESDCQSVADLAADKTGRVDVLINCAGFFPICRFDDMTAAAWRQVIDINLTGPFLMIKSMLPLMRGRGWGRIINFGSASVFEGVPLQAHYVAAKAGVVGLSRSLARVAGEDGITVNVIAPGLTLTPKVRDTLPADLILRQVQQRAIKRDEEPSDLIGAVLFLASPDADFLTGQTLTVDGGKHFR